jgi:hypothetical protein
LVAAPSARAQSRPTSALRQTVDSWRRAHERQILDEAFTLFAMPNLASDSAAIRRVAAHLLTAFSARGFTTALLDSPTGGPPAVYAERLTAGASRTIVLYAHYDGQPVAGAPWDGDPFTPALRRFVNGVAGEAVPLPAPVTPSIRTAHLRALGQRRQGPDRGDARRVRRARGARPRALGEREGVSRRAKKRPGRSISAICCARIASDCRPTRGSSWTVRCT